MVSEAVATTARPCTPVLDRFLGSWFNSCRSNPADYVDIQPPPSPSIRSVSSPSILVSPLSLPASSRMHSDLSPILKFRHCKFSPICCSCSCDFSCTCVKSGSSRNALCELKVNATTFSSVEISCSVSKRKNRMGTQTPFVKSPSTSIYRTHSLNSPSSVVAQSSPAKTSIKSSPRSPSCSIKSSPRSAVSSPRSPFTPRRLKAETRGLSGKRIFEEIYVEGNGEAEKMDSDSDRKENISGNRPAFMFNSSPFKRKRPPKLLIPEGEPMEQVQERNDPEVATMEGSSYGMYCKKGKRDLLEDVQIAVCDLQGNSKQAFFGVFDGHGGRNAAEFVAENLVDNIMGEISSTSGEKLEEATRIGYLKTDAAFLQKRLGSGASCVTALVRNGSLIVANAGDCRAVLCRNGFAEALTLDHRLSCNEDERIRIEKAGGYVDCFSGTWRLQGRLAVSRGIGDLHLKQWVSAEPDVRKLTITSDCEFLILASDGLWDMVSNEEAVLLAKPYMNGSVDGNAIAASKKLVEIASGRGCRDDISVLIIDLRNFLKAKAEA